MVQSNFCKIFKNHVTFYAKYLQSSHALQNAFFEVFFSFFSAIGSEQKKIVKTTFPENMAISLRGGKTPQHTSSLVFIICIFWDS